MFFLSVKRRNLHEFLIGQKFIADENLLFPGFFIQFLKTLLGESLKRFIFVQNEALRPF